MSQSDEIFCGLYPVYNTNSNFVSLEIEGNYVVNWGDGNTEFFSSGEIATHAYDYNSINPDTLTDRGYRQVLITATAQTGSSITSFNLVRSAYHPDIPIAQSLPWLDIKFSLPNLQSIMMYGEEDQYLGSLEIIKILSVGQCTDLSSLLRYSTSLREATIDSLSQVENISNMFDGCKSLLKVTLLNSPNLQLAPYLFRDCASLREVEMQDISSLEGFDPLFNGLLSLEKVVIEKTPLSLASFFSECISLKEVTIKDLSLLENSESTFEDCFSLEAIRLGNTPNLVNATSMFQGCLSLRRVSFTDLSNLATATRMFSSCFSLQEIKLPPTPILTTANEMFYYCGSLQRVVFTGGTSNLLNCDNMFTLCPSLTEVVLPALSSGVSLADCFAACFSLITLEIPGESVSNLSGSFSSCGNLRSLTLPECSTAGVSFAFSSCPLLSDLTAPQISQSFSIENSSFSKDGLVNVFENLGDVSESGGAIIAIFGNIGVADLQPSDYQIATDKGWTVISSPPPP